VYSIDLQDQTELVYQSFLPSSQELHDVFWIKSSKDIWHIKHLKVDATNTDPPKGRFADHFQRNEEKILEKTESFVSKDFPEISIESHAYLKTFIPFENRPLSLLLQQSLKPYSEKSIVVSHLHYKLATPLLSLLILIALAPIAMQFKRNKGIFAIVAVSLILFIAFMTILQGMLILGENQVLPGYIAIWGPLVFTVLIFIPRFAKTR
jgi:lipopolysaccharide export LptBFGC system permease protein LptF